MPSRNSLPADEEQVRTWIQGIRDTAIPEEHWQDESVQHLLSRYLAKPMLEHLVSLVEYLAVLRRPDYQRPRLPTGASPVPPPSGGDTIDLRARVFSAVLASSIERNPPVDTVRSQLFTGCLLSEPEMNRFVRSVAVRLLPVDSFHSNGIPLTAHDACLAESFDESRIGHECTPTPAQVQISWDKDKSISIPVDADALEQLRSGASRSPLLGEHFIPGSALDAVFQAALELNRCFRIAIADAMQFIMRGKTPFVPPIQVGLPYVAEGMQFRYWPFELRIQPWVPPEVVAEVYRELQRTRGLAGQKTISAKVLHLFQFVAENNEFGQLTWEELLRMWNARHPDWAFPNYRSMRQEYYRYRDRIRFSGEPSAS